MTKQLIIDGAIFPLPLVGRAGVGGIPERCDLDSEINVVCLGIPPSLTLPHEGGGDLRAASEVSYV